jgi:hypothetical protein
LDKIRACRPLTVFVLALAFLGLAGTASADHSWSTHHWSQANNPLVLQVGDNVDDAKWGAHLNEAASDWSQSTVLDLPVVAGGTRPKSCRATAGRIEVCSERYGNTGWLGIAQIWLSGGHIVQGVAKLNDFYHDSPPYNTPSWKLLVMCQEVGHTFGLDHQDENFNTKTSPGTCMDYTNDPVGSEHPNSHDYEQLLTIYGHLHAPSSFGAPLASAPAAFDMPLPGVAQWGEMVALSQDGGKSVFVQDFGGGYMVVTHVTWTMEVAEELRTQRQLFFRRNVR